VREDYSADGNAWDYLPHDQARSRAYRWGEDGLAGFCDIEQRLCLSLALWNGRDPILKERAFGLTGPQGNHGEDVKEYWWYLDALPSHAWNRWRYHYPQGPFPYEDLIETNAGRSRYQPEYELLDTGAFDEDRYWITEVHYAKAGSDDLLMAIQVTNAGPEASTLHVLPTTWFRNTWSWDAEETEPRPALRASGDRTVTIDHPFLGALELTAAAGPGGTDPQLLFCENETNLARLYGAEPATPYPKDGINDHVIHGAATVNPVGAGTKCAFWYQVTVQPGQTVELRLRLRPAANGTAGRSAADPAAALGKDFDQVMAARRGEADEFYAELTPDSASADEALVLRQASAGMLWSKQLFYYDVARWLDGDPTQPAPPEVRKHGRNSKWRNFDGFDIISMPDKWEYPWFAAWDLAFHTVTLAHLDPAFAKYQLILICREWFQHPQGALPAYEWDFGDVNPPVHALAALQVFAIDGARDVGFLARVFAKLLVNFTWWVNREDASDRNVFEGGFLGRVPVRYAAGVRPLYPARNAANASRSVFVNTGTVGTRAADRGRGGRGERNGGPAGSAERQPSGRGVPVGARPLAQPLRVGPGFIRAEFRTTGQRLGEHERGGGLECAAQQIGGTGRLEPQGPPVLATRADLGEFHLAPRLLARPRGARHDLPAGQ
jgi:hypothetical protein